MATKKKTWESLTIEEKGMRAEYAALAKRADQRLVRLEEYATRGTYKEITKWAYANAQYDIRSFFGSEATRFNKTLAPRLSKIQVQARINAVRRFLESETSTISPVKEDTKYEIKAIRGVDDLLIRRCNSFNKTMGTDMTPEEFYEFMESGMYEQLVNKLGYGVAKLRIGTYNQKREDVIKRIEASKTSGRVNNPKLVAQYVTTALKEGKATSEELDAARDILPKEKKRLSGRRRANRK